MKIVSTEELINYKILPFNIYSEFGEKLFAAGEVLTPGKLLQLRHINILYRDDEIQASAQASAEDQPAMGAPARQPQPLPQLQQPQVQPQAAPQPQPQVQVQPQPQAPQPAAQTLQQPQAAQPPQQPQPQPEVQVRPQQVIPQQEVQNEIQQPRVVVETFDMNPSKISKDKLSVDDIDILSYKGPINKKSKIIPETQIKIKAFYNKILEMMEERDPLQMLGMFANVRDKIIQDIIFDPEDALFCSQLKLLGEYNKCHALNTAILSGAVAKKMELNENLISDIVLAGLLHDIGKTKVPPELYDKKNLTNQEQQIIQNHTRIGYKIIKNEMDLPENIAKVALEHHENNDASGYPLGKFGAALSVESQIVSVCNYFDNITSNRTQYKVKNTKEALRFMLEIGTRKFSAAALYTFVHMFSYNDTVNFEEMVL